MPEKKYSVRFDRYRISSLSRIAQSLGVSLRLMRSWVNGFSRPKRSQALSLFAHTHLNRDQMNAELEVWGFSHLSMHELRTLWQQRQIVRNARVHISSEVSSETVQKIQVGKDLQEQINELETKFSSISSRLEDNFQANKGSGSEKLSNDIDELRHSINEIQVTSKKLAAPVILPNPKDMQVTLVSSSSLDRLEEYRNEENKWFSVLTLFVGSILGLLTNLVTGGSLTPSALVICVVFLIMAFFSGWSAFGFRARATAIRNRILPDENSAQIDKSDISDETVEEELGSRTGHKHPGQ